MRVEAAFDFPFTPSGTYAQDTNLLLDIAEFLVQYREQIGTMKNGALEPLTADRVVMVARLIGEVAQQALDQCERESKERLSPALVAWLEATAGGAASPSS